MGYASDNELLCKCIKKIRTMADYLYFFLLVTLFSLKPRADTSPALDTDYGESGILGGLGHAEEHKP